MTAQRRHWYLTVLGSCGTADSFRGDGWPTFVDEGIRVFDYIGRTGFPSLTTGGLQSPDEVELTDAARKADRFEWGYQMASAEVYKTQADRLLRGARSNQALVFDVVSMFIFRQVTASGGRRFLSSWELEQYFRLKVPVTSAWLWELPYEPLRDAALAFLSKLREVRPSLEIGFHLAPICTNDGVRFKVDVINEKIDFYYRFCERLAADLEAQLPRMTTLQGERSAWGADPEHPYGRYPFHYALSYYVAFRQAVKRWLGLPEATELEPNAHP